MKKVLKRLGALMMAVMIAISTMEVSVKAETNLQENGVEAHKLPIYEQKENVDITFKVMNGKMVIR